MRNPKAVVGAILQAEGGLIQRRDHPEIVNQLDWLAKTGELHALLPGVYVSAARRDDRDLWARAVSLWDPDAVLLGRTAARITFWPEISAPVVEVASWRRLQSPGLRIFRRSVPPELVCEIQGVRCSTAALTALDLCLTPLGGNAIDTVLRTRAATLSSLQVAFELTPSRRGNADRRRLLIDSRDEPWSEAERDLHRLLRAAGIEGWRANHPFELLTGIYWIDVAFPKLMLAIEVDGRAFHTDAASFEADRWRQNDLVLAGWRVLRFTATMLRDQPHVVLRLIEQALAA